MKEEKFNIEIIQGKKAARINNDGYGTQLTTMRNGYQWCGMPVDREILVMVRDLIDQYLE